MRRVVITGMGAITPLGNSVEAFWNGIKEKKTGFGPITKFDTSAYKCRLAAEVKDFDPALSMDKKDARRMELFCQYAVAAAKEAYGQAGLSMEKEDAYRVGCAIGSGIGSLQTMEREHSRLLEKGPGRIHPLMVPMMISNMAAGNVSIQRGLKGKSCITPVGIGGFQALTALSTSEDPTRCSLPFDKNRSGFVMGEGAAVLVLEELSHARARGARILAEIVGYGNSSDAYHITSPAEDGAGAAYAMCQAIRDAGITPEDVTYINAHGTGTHHNDLFETRAIKKAFGAHAKALKINSTKSMIGHLLGAAGAAECIACVKELEEGWLHPTVGLTETEEEMDLDYLPGDGVHADVTYALSNSLGFGGHNSSILLKKYDAKQEGGM